MRLRRFGLGHRHQQMFGRGVVVLHLLGDFLRFVQNVGQVAAHAHLHRGTGSPWQAG